MSEDRGTAGMSNNDMVGGAEENDIASQETGLGGAESDEDGMMTEHAGGENGTHITVSEDRGNAGMSKSVTVGNAEVNDIASQERGLSGAESDEDGMMPEHVSGENATHTTVSKDRGMARLSNSDMVGGAEEKDIASQERGAGWE